MWPRKTLDLGIGDLAWGALACLLPGSAARRAAALEGEWAPEGDGVVALSVRTAFDQLLAALELPAGSEILYSAATIGQMVDIVEHHGLVAVPIDVDMETLEPDLAALRAALTPRSQMLLLVHLFGARIELTPYLDLAREHGLFLVEDCAHAFVGVDDAADAARGDRRSDASLFSFGSIKTATALGGALARVRDPELRKVLRERLAQLPSQSRLAFAAKVGKYSLLKALTRPAVYGLLWHLLEALGRDPDRTINGAVRGFVGGDFFAAIRRRPSLPLLSLLRRRLRRYGPVQIRQRRERGERALELLRGQVEVPGLRAERRTHWVFPVLVDDRRRLLRDLRREGFDAATGTASFGVVRPSAPAGAHRLPQLTAAFQRIVFLPVYRGMPMVVVERLCRAVLRSVGGSDSRAEG